MPRYLPKKRRTRSSTGGGPEQVVPAVLVAQEIMEGLECPVSWRKNRAGLKNIQGTLCGKRCDRCDLHFLVNDLVAGIVKGIAHLTACLGISLCV